jgi:hypothetical protein
MSGDLNMYSDLQRGVTITYGAIQDSIGDERASSS